MIMPAPFKMVGRVFILLTKSATGIDLFNEINKVCNNGRHLTPLLANLILSLMAALVCRVEEDEQKEEL